ncbi:MAG: hypothetical protein IPK17_01515 [Chloroflexi bacterium]|uniref:hypothetical protein n=1 Tax=Candidatus Flexifilum breve TaxID=3140694 RepID=UPI003137437D|nr:hypothetical protein [Chloroflexota bacterium]
MIRKLHSILWRVLPRQRIPKLPRGLLSGEYARLSPDEARVLARLGARDPRGIAVAMKRYKVDSIDELVKLLKHHEVDRQFRQRLSALICRMTNSHNFDPNAPQMRELGRELRDRNDLQVMEMRRRVSTLVKTLERSI